MHKKKPVRKRELYFDVLWVIAIFFLIFSYSDGVNAYLDYEVQTVPYYIALFGALFSHFPLWLCLMISGAILLDMHEPIKRIWQRRIVRVVIILVVASFAYYINEVIHGREEFKLLLFIPDIYSQEQVPQFWYLYAFIGFLVCLPFLRPMVKNMRNADFIYLIMAVFVLSSILPLFNLYVLKDRYRLNENTKLSWIQAVIFIYPVMGYYIHHRMERRTCKRVAPILLGVDLLWLIYNTHIFANRGVSSGDYYMYPSYHNPVTMLHCLTLFVCAKALFDRMETGYLERAIGSLGGCSLGIYLLFPAFLGGRVDWIEKWRLQICGNSHYLGRMGKALIWSLIVYFACFIPVWLIRRIPPAKKLTV
ncbi:MAG: acyltransferase family protein [Lachnospiraceae bacterium]|nr:acyltransferase family protein [Lachnospiraceae bacterium]